MEAFSVAKATVILLALVGAISAMDVRGQTICNVTIKGLQECLPSVKPPNPIPPTAACCTALKSAEFPCLCKYKDNPIIKTMGIDIDLAMKLPAQCNIPGAPSHC